MTKNVIRIVEINVYDVEIDHAHYDTATDEEYMEREKENYSEGELDLTMLDPSYTSVSMTLVPENKPINLKVIENDAN